MQPRPFEEWIEKGHQRDANLCGACARPTDERSLVRGTGGSTRALLYTLPRRVGVGCVRVLMEWFVWMWRVALSLAAHDSTTLHILRRGSAARAGQAFYSQSRDVCGVQGCGQGGGGSEVWLHARVL